MGWNSRRRRVAETLKDEVNIISIDLERNITTTLIVIIHFSIVRELVLLYIYLNDYIMYLKLIIIKN